MSSTTAWIAHRLREARERRGWSQAELARRLDKTQTAISYWEAGKRTPGLDDLLELSFALDEEFDFFLPPERARQPVSAILRAEVQRLASDEMAKAIDDLLDHAEMLATPAKEIEVGGRHPAYAANELLEKAQVDQAPVRVGELANRCGVKVVIHNLPDAMSGLLIETDTGAIIGVNDIQADVRRRFTIAHELGHHLLGHADRFHIDVSDGHPPGYDYRSERAANEFAADLLMPRRLLSQAFRDDDRTRVLASRFEVSELAMGYRLLNLGLR